MDEYQIGRGIWSNISLDPLCWGKPVVHSLSVKAHFQNTFCDNNINFNFFASYPEYKGSPLFYFIFKIFLGTEMG